jgi:hypothetical protein
VVVKRVEVARQTWRGNTDGANAVRYSSGTRD